MTQPATLRVALAQLNYTVGDVAGNLAAIETAVDRARAADADLLVCSELSLPGYPPNDLVTRPAFVDAQLDALDRVAALTDDDLGVLVGYVDRNPAEVGRPYRNAAALCHRGAVVGRTHKCLLPTYDVFDEDRYFEANQSPHVLEFDGVGLGVHVCEDAWNEPDVWERPLYDRDPVEELVAAGADVLVNLSASPFYAGKAAFRRRLFAEHAAQHDRWFVFCNQVGGNDELVFDGRSLVVGPDGDLACRLADFEAAFEVCDVPLDGGSFEREPTLAPVADEPVAQTVAGVELGLRDYVHKSGFEDVVVGLSGGTDSAVTAVLAARALGPAHVLAVGLSTRYTSEASVADARQTAEALGIDYLELPVDDTYGAFLDQLDPVVDTDEVTVTLENVQARIRGVTLMALANEYDRLVLVTSNRSELAVGYCTLYGDMCGALAPLADCPKTLVYELAAHLNETADGRVIPDRVIDRPPSAELRPDQTDQDTLPPYETLDAILAAYVDDGLTAAEIIEAGHDPETVRLVLEMVHRAEYKRFQAAPVVKVSEKSFGVGWRYPLAADYGTVVPDGD